MTTPEIPSPDAPKFKPAVTEESNETKTTSGPGKRLVAAREAKNMAVTEVASLLRLDSSVIRAIDSDDVAKLPSATFVKGYLRGYGRLVGVDGELLVEEYEQLVGPTPDAFAVSKPVEREKRGVGLWLWVLFLLLLVVAVAWFWSKPGDEPVSTDTLRSVTPESSTTSVEATALAPTNPQDLEQEAADEVIEQLLRGLQDDTAVAGSQIEPTGQAESEPAEANSANNVSSEAAPAAQIATNELDPAVADSAPTPTPTAEPEPAPVVVEAPAEPVLAPGFIKVVLKSEQESWVSIIDARDERVFRNLLQAGVTAELEGKAPLRVNLGNAKGVTVLVNGQEYDHSSWHRTNNTARFVLNPAP